MAIIRAYRRIPTGTSGCYERVDEFSATVLDHAIDSYKESYLHDERNGTEIIFVDDNRIVATFRVERPAPPVTLRRILCNEKSPHRAGSFRLK